MNPCIKDNDKIKTLYILATLRMKTGPINIFTNLVRFKNDRVEYVLCAFEGNDSDVASLKINKNIKIIILPGYTLFSFFFRIFRLIRVIKKFKPKIVVADGNRQTIIIVSIVKWLFFKGKRPKLVLRFGNVYSLIFQRKNAKQSLLDNITRFTFRKVADYVICPSVYVKDDLVNTLHISESKVRTIYNPIDVNTINYLASEKVIHPWINGRTNNKDNIVFIAVCNLVPRKGIEYLIDAFSRVVNKYNSCRLLIIGEGSLKKKLKNKVRYLGLSDKIEFMGRQENPYKFMKHAFALVHPALWEGLGIVLLEAMACGLPIITTDSPGGIKEIIKNEVNGLLVQPKDSDAMAEEIYKLIEDKELQKRLVLNGYKMIKDFSADKIVLGYENIFEKISSK